MCHPNITGGGGGGLYFRARCQAARVSAQLFGGTQMMIYQSPSNLVPSSIHPTWLGTHGSTYQARLPWGGGHNMQFSQSISVAAVPVPVSSSAKGSSQATPSQVS